MINIKKGISGIYCIENNLNGKLYIGSAKDIKKRWQTHITRLNYEKHESQYLQRAWNKNPGSFTFKILEIVEDKNNLIQREQFWLDTLKPFGNNGYNSRRKADSNLGIKWSSKQREKNENLWTDEYRKEQGKKSAKTYTFISPEGNKVIITNLHEFCEKHNLCYCHMLELINGKRMQHKGWKHEQGRHKELWDLKPHSSTGIRGVYQSGNKYKVSIARKHYGYFDTLEEAKAVAETIYRELNHEVLDDF